MVLRFQLRRCFIYKLHLLIFLIFYNFTLSIISTILRPVLLTTFIGEYYEVPFYSRFRSDPFFS